MSQEYTSALSSAKLINAIVLKPLPLSASDIARLESNVEHLKAVVAKGVDGDATPLTAAIATATAAIMSHDKTGTQAEIAALVNAVLVAERNTALAALKTAQDALAVSEAKVASLQAQIDAYTPPTPTPTVPVVSMRQARLALNAAGLLDAVEAAVAEAGDGVKIEWEYAAEVRRDWPTLVALAGALNLTDEQLDDLFAQAAAL